MPYIPSHFCLAFGRSNAYIPGPTNSSLAGNWILNEDVFPIEHGETAAGVVKLDHFPKEGVIHISIIGIIFHMGNHRLCTPIHGLITGGPEGKSFFSLGTSSGTLCVFEI